MELTILHLYPDCMSLYGEYANVMVLRRHLEAMGVSVAVETALFEDAPDVEHADFIYMGAGTERTQKAALSALLPHKEALKAAIDRGAVLLFTGNAMEMLGLSITDAMGKRWPGLGLADFSTLETAQRCVGDVLATSSLLPGWVVGFMNKCSVTEDVTTPLFNWTEHGPGNEWSGSPEGEGYVNGNVFATHLTGPVLVKNPDFTDFLIRRIFELKGWELPEKLPVLPYEREAYEVTVKELTNGKG
ncbi:MAG: hypothetical protein K2M15_08565 [Oscillospiraceae bacterium]|nr:hypothetical protein [Oscillospiraceae bacterium]